MKKIILFMLTIVCVSNSLKAFADGNRPKGKFCFLGDTGRDSPMQKRVAKAMQEEGCADIFILGDIVYPDGLKNIDDPLLEQVFFKAYRPLMEKGINFHLVMGNHDHDGVISVWKDVAKKSDKIVFPNAFYAETWGDVCLLALDTQILNSEGQSEWLKTELERVKTQCRFTFAIGHHPYYSIGLHGDAKGKVKLFLEENIISHVQLYIAGHDHNISDEGEVKGTRMLVNGGGGAEIRLLAREPRVFGKSAWGFITLEFTQNENQLVVHYRIVEIPITGAGKVVHKNDLLVKIE